MATIMKAIGKTMKKTVKVFILGKMDPNLQVNSIVAIEEME